MLQEEEQMLVNMKKILEIAEAEGYAIPCINTPNEETVRAVIGAAEELNTPIIIDHAQVHDSLIPIERIGPIMLKYAKEARVPVCVHLDHGSDYEFVMRAVKVGFPSIMYDCSALPFEENVEKVAQFVKFAHAAGITVEAELGIMASTDEDTHDDDPEIFILCKYIDQRIAQHGDDADDVRYMQQFCRQMFFIFWNWKYIIRSGFRPFCWISKPDQLFACSAFCLFHIFSARCNI